MRPALLFTALLCMFCAGRINVQAQSAIQCSISFENRLRSEAEVATSGSRVPEGKPV